MDKRLAAHLELAALSNSEFVDRAYRLVVRRPPDPEGRSRALTRLEDGTLSRAALLAELAESEEFVRIRTLDDAVAFALAARAAGRRPRGLAGLASSDERAIEIPWVLSRVRDEKRVLDVGYANAEPAYLAALVAACPREPVGADLVETPVPGLRTVVADARSLPFGDGAFDVVICISTLEHVGRDNRLYGAGAARDDDGIAIALREFRRVLSRSGRLLVTVPCGRHEERDEFVQLPVADWLALVTAGGFAIVEYEVYARAEDGWRSAADDEVAALPYGESGASAVLCAELEPRSLLGLARSRLGRSSRGP